ncbi:MAG: hypothetical protein E7164_03675 [Firmicutes bacterium]|nr:hypothetical protein [Bacillota bacterium]
MEKHLQKATENFSLGKILSYEKLNSSENNVYKVSTQKGVYVIKIFSKSAIKNIFDYFRKKKQIEISKVLAKADVPCILPLELKGKNFFKYEQYYLVYPYLNEASSLEFTEIEIRKVAQMQSKIHKLKICKKLPLFYKKLKFDFGVVTKKFAHNLELTNLIQNRLKDLNNLIDLSNQGIKKIKNNLCITHNDFKKSNILWINDQPVLIDFDTLGLANPTCTMIESAYNFAIKDNEINFAFLEAYFNEYKKSFGKMAEDFNEAFWASLNGKLRWYQYLVNQKREQEILKMTKMLLLIYDNQKEIAKIYERIDN